MTQSQSTFDAHTTPEPRVPPSLRRYLTRRRNKLTQNLLRPGHGGVTLARKHSLAADEMLRDLFTLRCRGASSTPLLLGAVGGYGRRALGLYSDLDLCFITPDRCDGAAQTIEAFLYPLWDAGINVDHQVLCPFEAVEDARADLKIATELLDFRPLAGDVALIHQVHARLAESLFSAAELPRFVAQLETHAHQRHKRYGDSVYLLEPDIKNGTGGLRDLDFAQWAARARFGTRELDELVQLGVLTAQEHSDAERAVDFLWTVRNHLHGGAGRKVDRLSFAEQERVAETLDYDGANASTLPDLQRIGERVESFMSDYYRHARCITRTCERILGRARRRTRGSTEVELVPIGDGLVRAEGGIGLAHPERLHSAPQLAFAVYEQAIARELGVLSHTRDAIACATASPEFCAQLRQSRDACDAFVRLLCTSREVYFASRSVMSELHDVGLLLAMIPEFAPVVGRVHHDLYHVYTVDVHSIAAVDRLRALVRGDLVAELPLASRLAAETTRPRVLFMATLLHDVGKTIGGRDHARRGAEMAQTILTRLGFQGDELDAVTHLILHHLTMYLVAVRRDLADPATLEEFLPSVSGREGLRELYLLTLADVSTTSPVAMTHWKRNMLDALFRASDTWFAGATPQREDRLLRVQSQARALWPDASDGASLEEFLTSMPPRYFLANTPEDVVAHAQLSAGCAAGSVSVSLRPSPHEGVLGMCVVTGEQQPTGLCVVAGDQPGLLASIAAAISRNRFEIQAADINTRRLPEGASQAVDVFWVRSTSSRQPAHERLSQIERDLTEILNGDLEAHSLLEPAEPTSWRAPHTPRVATEITFDHASEHYTVIEVLTENRIALLFTLARTLHELGLSIGVAKISTEGKRAVDVFYAAEADGSKLQPGARTDQVRTQLLAAVRRGEPQADQLLSRTG